MQDPRAGLTKEQVSMLDGCIQNGAGWITKIGSGNHELLQAWVDRGWATQVDMEIEAPNLIGYMITEAGKLHFGEAAPVEVLPLKDLFGSL